MSPDLSHFLLWRVLAVSSQRWVLNSGHLDVESLLFNHNIPETVEPFLFKYLFILLAVLGLS